MICGFSHLDGAYVLGSLSPAERLEYEQHLEECPDCSRAVRELAGLPGLLTRVDPTVLESTPAVEPLPDTLLPALVGAVRHRQRRRAFATVGAAAAATAALVILPLAISGSLSGDRGPAAQPPAAGSTATPQVRRPMVPVRGAPVRASLAFERVPWGTRLDLACTYAPGPDQYRLPHVATYVLVVRKRDGSIQQVGTWRSLEGRTMRLTAATSASQADIASVEVRTTDGKPVLKLTA
ncbi:MAG: zf-HC2 domain-containing protein [Actinomycetota bacterium]|nr:zf-HC2 domain-containing protein [Actinomycetota bacterium]